MYPPNDQPTMPTRSRSISGNFVAQRVQPLHLIFERHGAELLVDRPLPVAAAARRAAVVDGDDDEPLVGEPLRHEPVPHRLDDVQVLRPAVHVHDHRVLLLRVEVPRPNDGGVEFVILDRVGLQAAAIVIARFGRVRDELDIGGEPWFECDRWQVRDGFPVRIEYTHHWHRLRCGRGHDRYLVRARDGMNPILLRKLQNFIKAKWPCAVTGFHEEGVHAMGVRTGLKYPGTCVGVEMYDLVDVDEVRCDVIELWSDITTIGDDRDIVLPR